MATAYFGDFAHELTYLLDDCSDRSLSFHHPVLGVALGDTPKEAPMTQYGCRQAFWDVAKALAMMLLPAVAISASSVIVANWINRTPQVITVHVHLDAPLRPP
jgi:hypothetical protein